jgi:hypothetical protein
MAQDPSCDQANERTGRWTAVEDNKLKDAAQTHGKDWGNVAAMVPGRTNRQCSSRWHNILDPSIDRTNGRTCNWTTAEDSKLKDAVQTHGKKWDAAAALVPDRTNRQCCCRWHNILDPSIDRTNERTGKWSKDEDFKLKDAVQTHGDKNWVAITALVLGRTKFQCRMRWKDGLNSNIDPATLRAGKWGEDEDIKLKDAVETHGGKHWAAIATLVPGRTEKQCRDR